jgi:hypothetical protein
MDEYMHDESTRCMKPCKINKNENMKIENETCNTYIEILEGV